MKRREYHGHTDSCEYRVWATMLTRCHNPHSRSYVHYGARGILVCEEWRLSFAAFYADVGPRPSPTHTIDRIDNLRGYEPGNVRWEPSRRAQKLNSRRTHWITYQGDTLCIGDWAKRIGLSRMALTERLQKWPLERAMSEPRHHQHVTHSSHRSP